jgi:hypothetical protein
MNSLTVLVKRTSWHVVRVIVAFVPLIGYEIALKHDIIPAFWPPLGAFDKYGITPASVAIVLIGWVLPEKFKTKTSQARASNVSGILMVATLVCYVVLALALVKEVKIPGRPGEPPPPSQYRSIGFERSDEAKTKYPHKSAGELLEVVGLEDKDIERAWTPASIIAARSALFFTYFLFLVTANVTAGLQLKRLSGPLLAGLPRP